MRKIGIEISSLVALFALIILSSVYFYSRYTAQVPNVVEPDMVFNETPAEIIHGDTTKKQVIFTFDGGSGAQSANNILETLKKHAVKGTFFLSGIFMENNVDFVERLVADGHEIFNHTYSHPFLTKLTDDMIAQEFRKSEDIVNRIANTKMKPYFRAPYADRDSRVLDVAARNGYRSVYWTIDALDWMESEGVTEDQVINRIMKNLGPGEIILMHIGDNITGAVLDRVFTEIESKGYKIVSLTEGI